MTDFAALLQPDRGQPARTIEIVHPDAYEDWLKRQPQAHPRAARRQQGDGQGGQQGDPARRRRGMVGAAGLRRGCDVAVAHRVAARFPARGHVPAEGRRGRRGGARLAARAIPVRAVRQAGQGRRPARPADRAIPRGIDETVRLAQATALVRDLVNTGSSDMGPAELEAEAEKLAKQHHATRPRHARRCVAQGLSDDRRGRPRRRQAPRAAADRARMGQSQASARRGDRQGRVLRFGRARHQAGERHAADEEGYGRRGARAGAGEPDHGRAAAGAAAPADPRGRECDLGRRLPPRRRAQDAQGPDGREHQHRRRGPAGARRRADQGGRGQARNW